MRSTFQGRASIERRSMLHFSRQSATIPFFQILPVSCQLRNVSLWFAPTNMSLSRSEARKDTNVRASFSPTGRRSHPYLVRARRSYWGLSAPSGSISRRSLPPHPRFARCIAPHLSPSLPPTPTQSLRGHSLNVSGIVASFSNPSSDYARRDKDGTALWTCWCHSTGELIDENDRKLRHCPVPVKRHTVPVDYHARIDRPLVRFALRTLAVAFSSPGRSAARPGGVWTVRLKGS